MTISLKSQIAEVERELEQRRRVYPRLVMAKSMRQGIADIQIQHMEAVRGTLLWLQKHEAAIKQKVEQCPT